MLQMIITYLDGTCSSHFVLRTDCISLPKSVDPHGVKLVSFLFFDVNWTAEFFSSCYVCLRSLCKKRRPIKLAMNAFRDCVHLVAISLPDGLSEIGESAFENCESLKRIHLPDSVRVLSPYSFAFCLALEEFVFPPQLVALPEYALYHCVNIRRAVFPPGLEFIRISAFHKCLSLEVVVLPPALKVIEPYAFSHCISLRSIRIPRGISILPDYVFDHCEILEEIYMCGDLKRVGLASFSHCYALTSPPPFYHHMLSSCYSTLLCAHIIVSLGIDEMLVNQIHAEIRKLKLFLRIPESAFYRCRMFSSFCIPQNFIAIEKSAFNQCERLSRVVFPPSLRSIESHAFYGCASLTELIFYEGLVSLHEAFMACHSLRVVILPRSLTSCHLCENFLGCVNLSLLVCDESLYLDATFQRCRFPRCVFLSYNSLHLVEEMASALMAIYPGCSLFKIAFIDQLAVGELIDMLRIFVLKDINALQAVEQRVLSHAFKSSIAFGLYSVSVNKLDPLDALFYDRQHFIALKRLQSASRDGGFRLASETVVQRSTNLF